MSEQTKIVLEYLGLETTKREQEIAAAGAKAMLMMVRPALSSDALNLSVKMVHDLISYALPEALVRGEIDAVNVDALSRTFLAKYSHDVAQRESAVAPGALLALGKEIPKPLGEDDE